ncbi:NAD(P)H-dependent glycerol-3-phosphate dehydrogenase [Methanoculleus sp.]|uniref:NAD(P)H-dependent glycerol-3-phosphate dehydrogenase n=1 Tax=Methanoculleus sp. TaxID=90427 RepID=UPI0025FA31B1|nr:NAD(P)H-dependent glycerol-3-phosphate dehydrogenase [Methanoculleus sp.]
MIGNVGIIGAGSMGTALAQSISRQAGEVTIYGRRQEVVDSINHDRSNTNYFPGLLLNPNIHARLIGDGADIQDCEVVIIAVPSSEVRSVIHTIRDNVRGAILVTVSKGLEYPSLKTMSEIISEETGNPEIASFSGPNFADEIAYGHIAGATVGTDSPSVRAAISELFEEFTLDFSDDVRAVELCGVLKNVYAIGTGMWDSVYSNYNEHYTFLNICYKEMCSFLEVISRDKEIFTKFCCFADFNLTANVDKSRNRTLGLMVGKNIIKAPYFESGVTFEGAKSVKGILELANRQRINMPIATFVYEVLSGNNGLRKTADLLLKYKYRS